MAFNFPSGAVPGQQYTTDNGITYVFDGQIWNVVATPASNTLVGNVTIDGGLELTGSISGGYSRIHFVSESSGEVGSNLSTIQMVPDINSPSSEQILIIDPTGGYPNHLHLRPGGPMDNSGVSIILGGENSNVSVIGGTNPPIQITSNNYLWQFNTDGTLIFPDYTNQTTAFTGLPIGSVSGSSQLTSSFDERYTLSGSVQPLPNGLISGSSQLTSSYDTRYTLSGSVVNSNINTGSFATTGSNDFVGNQVITGSLTISGSSTFTNIGPSMLDGTVNVSNNLIVTGSSMFGSGSFNVLAPEKFLVIQDDPENYNIVVAKADTDNYSQLLVTNLNSGISASSDVVVQADNGLETNMYADLGINSSNFTGNGNGIGAANDAYVYGKAKDFWVGNLTTESLYLFANEEGIPDATLSNGVFTFSSPIVANGGITGGLDYSNLTNLPSIVSSSQQITDFGFITSSQTIDTSSLLTNSSYQIDSSSFDDRINNLISAGVPAGTISGSSQLTSSFDTRYAASGSNLTYFLEAYANVTYTLPGTFTEDTCRYSVVSTAENVPSNWFNTSTYTFTPQKAGYWEIVASYDVYRNTEASMAIKKNGSIVAAAGSFNAVAQEVSKTVYLNGSTDYINIINVGGAALQRDQYQTRSWFQAKFVGVVDSSAQLPLGLVSGSSQLTSSYDSRYVLSGSVSVVPSGTISGSSQLTSSFDTRYTLSGSVVSGTTPTGTISGSSQLTSSFDGRYVQTGSFNSLTASFNSFTSSAQSVTTGSNSFNGTQTITGSLIITTGSFVASQILANTSSLYLTSGSNMYVQNNGLVEITGSLIVSGSTMFVSAGGDEGGEIQFGIPTTNTTLQNRVTVDVWRNRLRIFEGSAGANGVFIDLSKPTGNNNEITYKASGLVNAGTFVTLDNIKATVTTSSPRGLSLATISGTFACNIAGNYAGATVGASGFAGTATITTTPSTSIFGWGFTSTGDMANYIITDTTNSRAYRIIIQIGTSFNNNLVSIERLH